MVGLLDCWIAGLLDGWIAGWLDGWMAPSTMHPFNNINHSTMKSPIFAPRFKKP